MKRYPVWINGEMAMEEVARIFRDAGWHMHCRNGLMVVDPVPSIIAKDTNVLPMRERRVANTKGKVT